MPVIPILYNLSESQSIALGSSFWSSSFLTGTNNEQYLVISHVLNTPAFSYFRASTLDLETLHHNNFITIGNITVDNNRPTFNLDVNSNGFDALSADNVSTLHTYSTHKDLAFDITWEATSRVLSNAGSGSFAFGPGATSEWGIPSGRTQGSITVGDGKEITIDPTRSFTWYDRQWGSSGAANPGNWTWFEIHIPDTSYKLSIWAIDTVPINQYTRFATLRGEDGQTQVLPVQWIPHYKRTFQSHAAEVIYPLDWTVRIRGFGELDVSSVVEDQELVGASALETAYTGFVTFSGKVYNKKVKGYGVVELVHTSWE